jgi:hypothetical protein
MQGDRQRGLEKSPTQALVAVRHEIRSRQWKRGDIEVLVRMKIKKIPRLQFIDFEWNKEQLETIEFSLAS